MKSISDIAAKLHIRYCAQIKYREFLKTVPFSIVYLVLKYFVEYPLFYSRVAGVTSSYHFSSGNDGFGILILTFFPFFSIPMFRTTVG
jgi:hypothetical protein